MFEKLRKDRRAASAVEFALIAPFLMLLVGAILAYGSLFATSLSLQQLAAETARATIGGLSDSERKSLAETYLAANASSYPMIQPSQMVFNFDNGGGGSTTKVTLSYDLTTHPAFALNQLLPMPKNPMVYTMIITDGDGASS